MKSHKRFFIGRGNSSSPLIILRKVVIVMDKDKIVVFDRTNERRTVSRHEYYAKLMAEAYGKKKVEGGK